MAEEKKIKLTEKAVRTAIQNLAVLLDNVKIRDYASSTRDTGGVKESNPRDEGYDMARTGLVKVNRVEDTEIEFGITTRQGRSHIIMVSLEEGKPWLKKVISDPKGEMNTVMVDPKKPLENASKLEFSVEGYLKNNAMALVEMDGDDSIAARLVRLLVIRPTLMLVGWVGCGKTHNLNLAYDMLCDKYGPWERFDFTGSDGAREDDLLGSFTPKLSGPGFDYNTGVLNNAFEAAHGGKRVFLYVNEINRFNPRTQSIFVQAMDLLRRPGFTGFRFFNYHTQKAFEANALFDPADTSKGCIRIVSSINIGDQGTHNLSAALKRRFSYFFPIYYLPPEQEASLLQKETGGMLSAKVCKGMVAVANAVREDYRKMKVASPLDTGSLIDWAVTVSKRIAATPEIILECAEQTWLHKCVMYEANGVPAEESEKALKDIVAAKLGATTRKPA